MKYGKSSQYVSDRIKIVDNIRIKWFFLTGEGLTFIDNQKALQKSNPVIQEGGPPTTGNALGNLFTKQVPSFSKFPKNPKSISDYLQLLKEWLDLDG